MKQRLWVVLAVAGLLISAVGLWLATGLGGASERTAKVKLDDPGNYLLLASGVAESGPAPVTINAAGEGRVIIVVGREADVRGYVNGLAGTEITGFDAADQQKLTTKKVPAAGELKPPANPRAVAPVEQSDLWVQVKSAERDAQMEYTPPEQGSWLVAVLPADDKAPAAKQLELTWPVEAAVKWWAWPVTLIGLLLIVLAALGHLRSRPKREDEDPDALVSALDTSEIDLREGGR